MQNVSFALLIAAIVGAIYQWVKRKNPLDHLPGPSSSSLISGNLVELFDPVHGWEFHMRLIQNYGSVVKLHGMFNERMLYVFDPEALRHVCSQDGSTFDPPDEALSLFKLIVGPGMASVRADAHRRQRKVMSPAFSLTYLRSMAPLIYTVVSKLRDSIASQVSDGSAEIDMLSWSTRSALEVIGQCGLGYSFDPLSKEALEDDYWRKMKALVMLALKLPILRFILPRLSHWFHDDFLRWALQFFPSSQMRELARLADHILRRSEHLYKEKKLSMQQEDEVLKSQVGEGKDIISLLMRANNAASKSDKLSDSEVVSQMTMITIAATDTTANAISQMLFRLAQRPDVQDNVRREILESGCDTDAAFDTLMRLPWLDAVVKESLRLDAPSPFVVRMAVKDTILPLSMPIRCPNDTVLSKIAVPKGTRIFLGIYGSNWNNEVWGSDAAIWKPERWFKPSSTTAITPGVFYNTMTFIGGSRSCIGFKFAEMELKITLAILLSSFNFELTEKPVYVQWGQARYLSVHSEAKESSLPLKVTSIRV